MSPMFDNLMGQLRNVDQNFKVDLVYENDDEAQVTVEKGSTGLQLLLLAVPNVAVGGGFWMYDGDPLIFDAVDAVVLYYGFSKTPGAIADCNGNPFKDDYRRLGRSPEDVRNSGRGFNNHYLEIDYLCSEDNLMRLWNNLPLISRSR